MGKLGRVTEDDFLTLTLPERIAWLHSSDGPRGKLSHDTFARILGTSRQVVIAWENGTQPSALFRERLADFSGFRQAVFSRREGEAAVADSLSAGAFDCSKVGPTAQRALFDGSCVRSMLQASLFQNLLPALLDLVEGGRRDVGAPMHAHPRRGARRTRDSRETVGRAMKNVNPRWVIYALVILLALAFLSWAAQR